MTENSIYRTSASRYCLYQDSPEAWCTLCKE